MERPPLRKAKEWQNVSGCDRFGVRSLHPFVGPNKNGIGIPGCWVRMPGVVLLEKSICICEVSSREADALCWNTEWCKEVECGVALLQGSHKTKGAQLLSAGAKLVV